jgi:hypothetical protein
MLRMFPVKKAAQGPAPPPGLKLVKSGEGSRPRPGTPARAQAAHVCVRCCAGVLVPIYVFTDR